MHKRGTHDVGGLPAGPIQRRDHVEEDWEIRLNSMLNLLRAPHIDKITIDEVRRNVETLGIEGHHRIGYLNRHLFATTSTLIQRGVISITELADAMEKLPDHPDYHRGAIK